MSHPHPLSYHAAKVTKKLAHSRAWPIVRVYLKYPLFFVDETVQHSILERLFNLLPDQEVLCDTAWTENHPVLTRNKGLVSAAELKVGDTIGELYYDAGLERIACGGVPIESIETYEFDGEVYDVKGESTFIFGRHLLGHMSKEPW